MIGTRLGDYEILHALKSGGMGDVLLARRRGVAGFEQLCAIKTVRAELAVTPVAREMFLDEARLLARLTHPGIAQILDFGEADGTAYMVIEYVPGMSFRALAERQPPPAVLCQAMAEACRGLHAAHELRDLVDGHLLGVVHRDISPENLMLGFDARVKVLDFGIALVRGRQAPVTELGTLKGKPPYMSPEQIKNLPLDRRSDVFSASVVLWELLTRRHLFMADSIYAVAKAIEEAPIVPPSTYAPGLPDGLDDLVMAGLARDPDRRLATAAAMAEVLERIAASATRQSLEAWVERALIDDRQHHARWLAQVLAGGDGGGPVGRPSGVATAVEHPAAPAAPLPPAGAAPVAGDAPTVQSDGPTAGARAAAPPPAADAPTVPPPRRRWALALVALVALAGGGAVVLATRGGAAVAIDAAPTDATSRDAATDAAVVSDAAPVDAARPPVDAAPLLPPIDAGERRRDAGRPVDATPRPPIDAAVAVAPPIDAAAPRATGTLAIGAWSPAALVEVDGEPWGQTPILSRTLPAGRHEVVLKSPLDRAVVFRTHVDVAAGGRASVSPP